MKILIIHYRFYKQSGPETYLFNIISLLQNHNHEVIPFSIKYNFNEYSEYSKYFVKPIIEDFHYNGSDISLKQKFRIIINSFYNRSTYRNLTKLIEQEKPDIAYVLQYGTKLSSSIFDACHNNRVPVVLRLSDFNLVCSRNIFYRNKSVCTKCLDGIYNSLILKCVHNSLTQSFIYYLIQKFNQLRKIEQKINVIIAPSIFTIDLIKKSKQFKKNSFIHVPTFQNFVNLKLNPSTINSQLKLAYWGRISEDKGVEILIDALIISKMKGYNFSLIIIGDNNNDYAKYLENKVHTNNLQDVIFPGFKSFKNILDIVKNSHFSIIPSKWFDNMPNSLIESCGIGIPVIVSEIGSLKEVITDGYNGFTFKSENPKDLSDKLIAISQLDNAIYQVICNNSYNWIRDYCDQEKHYSRLIDLFKKIKNETYNKLDNKNHW